MDLLLKLIDRLAPISYVLLSVIFFFICYKWGMYNERKRNKK